MNTQSPGSNNSQIIGLKTCLADEQSTPSSLSFAICLCRDSEGCNGWNDFVYSCGYSGCRHRSVDLGSDQEFPIQEEDGFASRRNIPTVVVINAAISRRNDVLKIWICEEQIFLKLDPLAPILGGQSCDCSPVVFPGDFSSSDCFKTIANRSTEKGFGPKCQLLLDTAR